MTENHDDLPELTELEPLGEDPPKKPENPAAGELEEMTELEPLAPESDKPADAPRERPAAGAQPGTKRELEQVPLMLRKASTILLIGALTPFWVALKGPGDEGLPIPYGMLFVAKAIALVAAYIFHEGFAATHGGKHQGPIAQLSRAHKVAVLSLIHI